MSDAPKRKENKNGLSKYQKLDHARSLRGIHFIDPKDEEFKEIMETLKSNSETCSNVGKHKTKYACIVEADEFMRLRLEFSTDIMKITLL